MESLEGSARLTSDREEIGQLFNLSLDYDCDKLAVCFCLTSFYSGIAVD